MPRVTRLEPVGRNGDRVRVHLDGEPRATLPRAAAEEMGLTAGDELSGQEVDRLLWEARRQEAMDRALGYLAHRSRSRAELERHLRRKGYEDAVVEGVISRCRELGYVDDREFALSYVRDRIRLKPRGTIRLEAELRKKGVSEEDARAGIERAFREAGVDERDLLERAARKRWRSRRTDDPRKLRRRMYGYLQRRGFRTSEIREVVDGLMDGLEESG